MDGTKPITPRERELLGMETIASQMPIKFPNGACWTDFRGSAGIHVKSSKKPLSDLFLKRKFLG